MRWRLPLVLVLILCAVSLVPLAHAFPPDPSWIPGIYDDGDCDAAITLASSMVAVAEFSPPAAAVPVQAPLWPVPAAQAHHPDQGFHSTLHGRAPPLA